VARVITPGTLIDEQFMDPYANNFVLAIHVANEEISGEVVAPQQVEITSSEPDPIPLDTSLPIGLAWLDLSTGQFFTQSTTLSSLPSVLSRVSPSEIVLDEDIQSMQDHGIFSVLQEDKHLVTYAPVTTIKPIVEWVDMLESGVPPADAEEFTSEEVAAGSVLLQYVETRLTESTMKLQAPLRYQALEIMGIDRNSVRALEIKETIRDGAFKGSLSHAMRRTVTKSGARLLNNWLSKLIWRHTKG
jgi:DNA mismatch repair ATPase MutS